LEKELQNIDAVIHLACISNDPSFDLDPKVGKSINYNATKALIDLSIKHKVKRFIYASSSSVYGIKKERNVTEELSLCPLTDYSKYKALCEKYLLEKHSPDFCILIVRPSTVCGYSGRMRLDLTVNMLTMQAIVNKEITVFGGKQMRPNIHIKDMVDFYLKSLKWPKEKIDGKIYNLGYENYSIREIARMIKNTLGDKTVKIKVLPTNDLRSYRVSSQKIKKELGFVAKHTVVQAIKDIASAYQKGLIPNPETNNKYYNLLKMKELTGKML
jgi:nucleoside-diphosphate-sugar epimerase